MHMHICVSIFVCVYICVCIGFIQASIKLMLLRFSCILALLLKSCAPDPGGRQGGDYVNASCTGGCRYDSLLCDRCGMSTYSNRRPPRPCIKTLVIRFICMLGDFIGILLNTCCYICIYIYRYILTVLAKFYDMCNPEILCHC